MATESTEEHGKIKPITGGDRTAQQTRAKRMKNSFPNTRTRTTRSLGNKAKNHLHSGSNGLLCSFYSFTAFFRVVPWIPWP
jgi:hypothetical protein